MDGKATFINLVAILAAIGLGIYGYITIRRNTQNTPQLSPTPELTLPSPTPTPTTTPFQEVSIIEGTITSISPNPVGFENALVATFRTNTGDTSNLYITPLTRVFRNNELIDRGEIQPNTRVTAAVSLAEGGYEAVEIIINPQPTPIIPTPITTATPQATQSGNAI
jgi:hypothetical protein